MKVSEPTKGEVIYSDDEMPSDGEDSESGEKKKPLSKKKARKMARLTVAELKQLVKKLESGDCKFEVVDQENYDTLLSTLEANAAVQGVQLEKPRKPRNDAGKPRKHRPLAQRINNEEEEQDNSEGNGTD